MQSQNFNIIYYYPLKINFSSKALWLKINEHLNICYSWYPAFSMWTVWHCHDYLLCRNYKVYVLWKLIFLIALKVHWFIFYCNCTYDFTWKVQIKHSTTSVLLHSEKIWHLRRINWCHCIWCVGYCMCEVIFVWSQMYCRSTFCDENIFIVAWFGNNKIVRPFEIDKSVIQEYYTENVV